MYITAGGVIYHYCLTLSLCDFFSSKFQNGGIIWSTIHHDQSSYQLWKLSDKRPQELRSQSEAGWMNTFNRTTKSICSHTIICREEKLKSCTLLNFHFVFSNEKFNMYKREPLRNFILKMVLKRLRRCFDVQKSFTCL
jgi:hypothetical protein